LQAFKKLAFADDSHISASLVEGDLASPAAH
jgi:hypothetical protein